MLRIGLYGIGQGLAYAIDLASFLVAATLFPLTPVILVHLFSKATSALFAYFYHRHVSFRRAENVHVSGAPRRFVAVVLGNMLLTGILLFMLSHIVNLSLPVAKIAADIAGICATYLAMRLLVFPKGPVQ